MKFGNKSYLSWFAGVSSCGPIHVQSVCPEALGQSWRWGGQGHPFPGCAGNCHVVGKGRGRLESEPSVSKGFSCAQWLSPPYWARWVPRCWSRTLRVGSKLVPLLVSVHPPPPHWHICSPAAAIDIPGVEPIPVSRKLPSWLEPRNKVSSDHSGLREATGSWSRLHCSRQEEGTGE